jgi:hypothetical protein
VPHYCAWLRHTLQAGQSIITKHIRNGTELEPLGSKGWFR